MSQTSLRILITGSSSGFGRLTAEQLAEKGHTVLATMRGVSGKNRQNALQLQERAKKSKWKLHVIDLDVTDEHSVEQGVEKAVQIAGGIDVLINNAGFGAFGVTEAFTIEQARQVMEVNLFGVMRMNRAVLPHMRRQKSGLIIYLSSLLGRVVIPFAAIYNASKWGLEALAETYRYDLETFGIQSVIVQPGAFATQFGPNMLQPADQQRAQAYGPVQDFYRQFGSAFAERMAQPDAPQPQEVAHVLVDLVERPQQRRPLRVNVGADTAAIAPLNELSAQVQGQLNEMMGLKTLLPAAAPKQ